MTINLTPNQVNNLLIFLNKALRSGQVQLQEVGPLNELLVILNKPQQPAQNKPQPVFKPEIEEPCRSM